MAGELLAAVETGGTKCRAALVAADMTIVESEIIATTNADTTLQAVAAFFGRAAPVAALGIASFGPLDLDPLSRRYGAMADTPKSGWSGVDILARLSSALGVPADIQTDVEAAAVAEQTLGASPRPRRLAYVTVGTGIGAALAVDGSPWRGRRHSEFGHVPVRRVLGDEFSGRCPFHGDCLEGMACGPAMADRFGPDLLEADSRATAWRLEAAYLAQLVRVLTYSVAPDRIVFGGGVGNRRELIQLVREASRIDLGGYSDQDTPLGAYITTPALGDDSGLLGAALIARSIVTD